MNILNQDFTGITEIKERLIQNILSLDDRLDRKFVSGVESHINDLRKLSVDGLKHHIKCLKDQLNNNPLL